MPGARLVGFTVTFTVAGACVEVDPLAGTAASQVPPSAVLAHALDGVAAELLISTRTVWGGLDGAPALTAKRSRAASGGGMDMDGCAQRARRQCLRVDEHAQRNRRVGSSLAGGGRHTEPGGIARKRDAEVQRRSATDIAHQQVLFGHRQGARRSGES